MRTRKDSTSTGDAKPAKPTTHDEYLAIVDVEQRATLQKVREAIHVAAPGAEECISYQIPAFRLGGKLLIFYGATAKHCALYAVSQPVLEKYQEEIKEFDTSGRGTIRFTPERPMPVALIKKIVKALIKQRAAD